MFYDNFISLCEDAGVSPSKVLSDLSIGKAGLSRWREGVEPTNPIKKKIADYFGITVKELMETKKAPANTAETDDIPFALYGGDKKAVTQEDMEEILEFIRSKRKADAVSNDGLEVKFIQLLRRLSIDQQNTVMAVIQGMITKQ